MSGGKFRSELLCLSDVVFMAPNGKVVGALHRLVGRLSHRPFVWLRRNHGSSVPGSQTSVVSCPLALARTGLLPSAHWIPSALVPVARTYPLTTTIHFSGFNSAACVLASPLLRTPSFDDRTSVRLPTRWLAFGLVGLIGSRRRTHWVTMTSFKGCHPIPSSRASSRHDQ